ncbi:MAG: TlpA family protein disulfide reductase [Planctomycetaceae bacterium]|nr:TlpA family protein disulfide reductase [Planctomycetaceae bacterium]
MADLERTEPQPRLWRSPILWLLLVLVLVGLWATRQTFRRQFYLGPDAQPGVGQMLRHLALEPLTGDPPALAASNLLGHVTLLNFWGVWCPPCRDELPHMADLQKRFADQKTFRLAAISYPPGGADGDVSILRTETEALLKQQKLTLPTYYDSNQETIRIVDRLIGFNGFPTTLLVDRRGVIRAVWAGYRPGMEEEVGQFVEQFLAETPSTP